MKGKGKSRRALWFCAAAVVLAAAVLGGILLLSGDGTPAYIGHAEQGTAISIDEVGCEAASYVEIEMVEGAAAALPEELIELYLTRPFVFAILSENDVPLFLGVVCNPNGE